MRHEQIPNQNTPEQIPLDFGNDYLEERSRIAEQYKVMRPESLTKKDGKWLKDGIPVEEWEDMMQDNSGDPWRH